MPTPQNGQTHSNNSSAVVEEVFECVWPFCGVGVSRVNANNKLYDDSVGTNSRWVLHVVAQVKIRI